jgi:hypothetical protein
MTPFELVRLLNENKLAYKIDSVRDGYLMFEIAIPGARYEIEISEEGEIEIEKFGKSDWHDGEGAASVLHKLISENK